jgi:hypothetical protein
MFKNELPAMNCAIQDVKVNFGEKDVPRISI